MSKELEEMSLEELWQLFPIFLVKHNRHWVSWFEEEKENILSLIPDKFIERLSHIGSTSINDIMAKNIVDMLLEVKSEKNLEIVKNLLVENGWRCMNCNSTQIAMNKGYTSKGFADKVFHLRIRIKGDNDELYFRDYMNENKDIAKEYETLKLSLWKKFEHNRDGYTDAKTDFIKKYTEAAKEKYKGRY